MERALKENYVYIGEYSGVAYHAFTGRLETISRLRF